MESLSAPPMEGQPAMTPQLKLVRRWPHAAAARQELHDRALSPQSQAGAELTVSWRTRRPAPRDSRRCLGTRRALRRRAALGPAGRDRGARGALRGAEGPRAVGAGAVAEARPHYSAGGRPVRRLPATMAARRGPPKTVPQGPCANLTCAHGLFVGIRCECAGTEGAHSIFHAGCTASSASAPYL